jgi:CHAT domain-containing protein
LTFTTLQQALTLTKKDIGSTRQQVMLHSYLGDVLLAMQHPQAAQKQLEEALALADHSTPPELMIQTLNNLGNVLTLQAAHAQAIEKFTQAIKITKNNHKPTLKIQVLTNLAKTYFKQDNIQASLNELHTASTLLQQSLDSGPKLEQLLTAGKLALRLLRHPLYPQFQSQFSLEKITSDLLTQANQLAEKSANRQLIAYTKGYLGELFEINQQLAAALVFYRQAIFYSQGNAEISYYWQWRLGRIFQQQQQLLAAETAYKQALNTLQPVRTRMMTGQRDYMDMFYQRIQPIYYSLLDVLLQQARLTKEPLAKIHYLNQAKNVLEQQKAAEMQNYFQDQCISEIYVSKLANLQPNTAVLYPILLPDRVELLLMLYDELQQFVVPMPGKEVNHIVREFQKTLQQRTTFVFIHQAKALYQLLIAPIREQLDTHQIKTLVFVPDGILRIIPLAALHNGQHFLTEEFAIATTPGLDMTDPRLLPREFPQVLLAGLSESVQNFSPLPNVPAELNRINQLYEKTKILLNESYLLRNVQQALKETPYTIVHIASHGQFHRDLQRTFLLTYDTKITMDRLQQLIDIRRTHHQQVELLTLSACQTAVGDERAALGLAGVALKAGTRSAIASLWFVNDESTAILTSEFYRQLKNVNLSKAQALQLAQQKLFTIKKFQHPAYWAPFLLIGNWI